MESNRQNVFILQMFYSFCCICNKSLAYGNVFPFTEIMLVLSFKSYTFFKTPLSLARDSMVDGESDSIKWDLGINLCNPGVK